MWLIRKVWPPGEHAQYLHSVEDQAVTASDATLSVVVLCLLSATWFFAAEHLRSKSASMITVPCSSQYRLCEAVNFRRPVGEGLLPVILRERGWVHVYVLVVNEE